MATDLVSHDIPHSLALEVPPCVDHLVTEDDTPVDNIFSEKQQRLLTEPLFSSWAPEGEGRTFVVLANVGLFYSVREPPFVPDMMLSLDVELPEDVHPKPHRSYFLWEYGKPPDVVIEVVSNREGGETTDKLAGYARIGVKYYVIFDPDRLLIDPSLRAFRLEVGDYREMSEPIWLPRVGLGLQEWRRPVRRHGQHVASLGGQTGPTDSDGCRDVPNASKHGPIVWRNNCGDWAWSRNCKNSAAI